MRELHGENMRDLVERVKRLSRLNVQHVQHVADIRVVLYEKQNLVSTHTVLYLPPA